MVKVSVIIPVYNTERFLKECLDSIAGQSLKETEIICVNDGSQDSSLSILREYQQRDNRVLVLDQENKGLGAARNAGLAAAGGEYCYFMDSDDILLPGALEALYSRASRDRLDILYFGGESFFETEELREKFAPFEANYRRKVIVKTPEEGGKFFARHGSHPFLPNVYLQFCRTAFLRGHQLRFDERISLGEDDLFSFQAVHAAKRVECIPECFYRRRVRAGSLFTGASIPRRMEGWLRNFSCGLAFLLEHPVPEKDTEAYFRNLLPHYFQIQKGCRACSREEKKWLAGRVSSGEALLLRLATGTGFPAPRDRAAGDAPERVRLLTERAARAEQEIQDIRASWSYRIGRFLTFLPRKLRGGYWCFREHGLEYTWTRLLEQLRLARYQSGAPKRQEEGAVEGRASVSIIVPVYNAEKYLPRCLDSLLAQTVPPLEILCIDDGSTDASFQLLSDYAAKSPLIRVLPQRHQYAGAARNLGIRKAKGDYVLFVDSDDFAAPNLVERVSGRAKSTGADVVVFAFDSYLEREGIYRPESFSLDGDFLPEEDVFPPEKNADFLFQFTSGGPVNKCFRREFLLKNGLEFLPYRFTEDIGLVYPALACAGRIAVIRETLYHVTKREGSLSAERERSPEIQMEAYERCRDVLRERGLYPRYEKSFINQAMGAIVWGIVNIHDGESRQKAERLFMDRARWRLGIAGRPEEYFYLKHRYRQYQEIAGRHGGIGSPRPVYGLPAACRVSVVIPFYQSAVFLPELLESLLRQTLRDMEILCVDDGSTDGGLEIVKGFAARDKRVRWFRQENQGAGAARNRGIREARGEYLICLDADDLYAPNLLKKLYDTAQQRGADVVVCKYQGIDCWLGITLNDGIRIAHLPAKPVFSHWDLQKNPFALISQGPTNKLYRREFVQENGLRYSSTRASNDVSFWYHALFCAKRIACIPDQLITVRQHINPDSITSNRGEHIEDIVTAYRESYEALRETGLEQKYGREFCISMICSLRYNGRFREKDSFVEAVCRFLEEEPFCWFPPEELRRMLHYDEKIERAKLENLEKNLQKAPEEKKRARSLQVSMQKNLMANLRRIDAFLLQEEAW